MRVMITGGAGFIGSNLAKHHLNKGDKVHVLDNLSTGKKSNIAKFEKNPNFKFSNNDILLWPDIVKAVGDAELIYHLAAVVGVYRVLRQPLEVLTTNTAGCERLLRAARACNTKPRILLASSSEVYGPSQKSVLNEKDNLIIDVSSKIRWNYSISKLSDEALGLTYYNEYNIPITIMRIFNVIGPNQLSNYGMVVPRFIEKAMANKPIEVFGSGQQTRSFCDIRDMVNMQDLLASCDKSVGEIVNIGNDMEVNINYLAKLIKQITHSYSEIRHVPYLQAYGIHHLDIEHRKPDLSKLFRFTNYKPKYTLEASIKHIAASKKTQT